MESQPHGCIKALGLVAAILVVALVLKITLIVVIALVVLGGGLFMLLMPVLRPDHGITRLDAVMLLACEYGLGQLAASLIKKGANPNAPSRVENGYDYPPLWFALENRDRRLVSFLLDRGVSANKKIGSRHLPPLHWAVIFDDAPSVLALIQHGAPVNDAFKQETTFGYELLSPLYLALQKPSAPVVALLLHHGADPDAVCSVNDARMTETTIRRDAYRYRGTDVHGFSRIPDSLTSTFRNCRRFEAMTVKTPPARAPILTGCTRAGSPPVEFCIVELSLNGLGQDRIEPEGRIE